MPCLIQISKRSEEPVQETLANAMPQIFKALGLFTTDKDVKVHFFLNIFFTDSFGIFNLCCESVYTSIDLPLYSGTFKSVSTELIIRLGSGAKDCCQLYCEHMPQLS